MSFKKMRSTKQHTEYFNFRSKVQLVGRPVQYCVLPLSRLTAVAPIGGVYASNLCHKEERLLV